MFRGSSGSNQLNLDLINDTFFFYFYFFDFFFVFLTELTVDYWTNWIKIATSQVALMPWLMLIDGCWSVVTKAGVLTYLVKEVEQLVSGSAWYQPDMSQCQQCGRSDGDILQLESQLHLTQEAADRLQRLLTDKSEELKRRIEDNTNYQNQVTFLLFSQDFGSWTGWGWLTGWWWQ